MKNCKLSVIITTYKRNDTLDRAINSVLCENEDYEIIVVDDNDETSEYRINTENDIQKYLKNDNFIYIKHKQNKNGAAARNTGIKASHGKYITFLDDDDEFMKNRIHKVIEAMESGADFVCTGVMYKKNGKIINIKHPNINNKSISRLQCDVLSQKSFIGTGSNMVCKVELVKEIGGFDETFTRHQDIEFLIRYLEKCQNVVELKETLVVKNTDSIMNFPNFDKLYDVKEKFFNKFQSLIWLQNSKVQKEIYKRNINELIKAACNSGKKENIKKSIKIAKKYNVYSFIDFSYIYFRACIKKIVKGVR